MPTPIPAQTPAPTDGAAGVDQNTIAAIGQLPIFQEIAATLKQLTAAMAPPAAPAPAGDPGAAGAPPGGDPGAGGEGDELSDEELAQLLGGEGGEGEGGEGGGDEDDDESRKGQQPVQNMGQPGGTNTRISDPQVKLNRKLSSELAETRVKLARMEIKTALGDLRAKKNLDVDPNDEELVSDLAAMEPTMRNRAINRLAKNSRPLPSGSSFGLETAVAYGTDGNSRRIQSRDDMGRVMKLARDKSITYEAAAAELGFTVG